MFNILNILGRTRKVSTLNGQNQIPVQVSLDESNLPELISTLFSPAERIREEGQAAAPLADTPLTNRERSAYLFLLKKYIMVCEQREVLPRPVLLLLTNGQLAALPTANDPNTVRPLSHSLVGELHTAVRAKIEAAASGFLVVHEDAEKLMKEHSQRYDVWRRAFGIEDPRTRFEWKCTEGTGEIILAQSAEGRVGKIVDLLRSDWFLKELGEKIRRRWVEKINAPKEQQEGGEIGEKWLRKALSTLKFRACETLKETCVDKETGKTIVSLPINVFLKKDLQEPSRAAPRAAPVAGPAGLFFCSRHPQCSNRISAQPACLNAACGMCCDCKNHLHHGTAGRRFPSPNRAEGEDKATLYFRHKVSVLEERDFERSMERQFTEFLVNYVAGHVRFVLSPAGAVDFEVDSLKDTISLLIFRGLKDEWVVPAAGAAASSHAAAVGTSVAGSAAAAASSKDRGQLGGTMAGRDDGLFGDPLPAGDSDDQPSKAEEGRRVAVGAEKDPAAAKASKKPSVVVVSDHDLTRERCLRLARMYLELVRDSMKGETETYASGLRHASEAARYNCWGGGCNG